MKAKLWILLFILAVFTIGSATINCDDDDDDDQPAGDDDTGDDDTTDDDDDTAPQWPEGYSIDPFDGQTEVGLSKRVVVTSEITPMNRDTFTLRLLDGQTEVTGDSFFSREIDPFEKDTFYFFTDALLVEGKQYTVELAIDGETYLTSFTTVAEAGEIPIYGNADTIDSILEPYAYQMIFPNVLEPAPFAEIMQTILVLWKYMAGPGIVESADGQTGTMSFSIGEGEEFDGDQWLERNFSSTGFVFDGNINGPYVKINGIFEADFYGVTLTFEFFDVSVEFRTDKNGVPSGATGAISGYTSDCESLKEFLPEEVAPIIDEICDEGTLLVSVSVLLTYNPLDLITFDDPVITDSYIHYTFEPGVWANAGSGISPSSTILRFNQNGEQVLSSLDYPDNFDYYLDSGAAEGYRFTQARFYFPDELTADDYDIDFFLGLYCHRASGLTIPE